MPVLKKILLSWESQTREIAKKQGNPIELKSSKKYWIYAYKLTVKMFSTKCDQPSVLKSFRYYYISCTGYTHFMVVYDKK